MPGTITRTRKARSAVIAAAATALAGGLLVAPAAPAEAYWFRVGAFSTKAICEQVRADQKAKIARTGSDDFVGVCYRGQGRPPGGQLGVYWLLNRWTP